MADLGLFNTLPVTAIGEHAVLLDGGVLGELSLPLAEAGELAVGDSVEVFVYRDNHDVFTPTITAPLVQRGQVGWLKIVEVNNSGAFAHWGPSKDLFIPFGEQQVPLREGDHALVMVYVDNQHRMAGSTRIDRRLDDDSEGFRVGQQVSVLIGDRTELGYKAIVENLCWGLLYASELEQTVRKGETHTAWVKFIRPDQKLDLTLNRMGYSQNKVDSVAQSILDKLAEHDGTLMLSDKSSPDVIQSLFGVSKKVFKQALGALYKQRRVELDGKSIKLVKK
jgi:predicted RNA-binding protein (virulence factor B family)